MRGNREVDRVQEGVQVRAWDLERNGRLGTTTVAAPLVALIWMALGRSLYSILFRDSSGASPMPAGEKRLVRSRRGRLHPETATRVPRVAAHRSGGGTRGPWPRPRHSR